MRIYKFIICGALFMGLASCSSEDTPTAERDTLTDCFAPDPNATDEESVLRRNFKQEEGSYILFNDTLTHEYLGKDYNGDDRYKTETLDMGYTIGNTSSAQQKTYVYEYITEQSEKEAAVAFLKDYVLTHLPQSLRPFSWFLCKTITYTSDYTMPSTLTSQRCIAVALGDIKSADKQAVAAAACSAALAKGLDGKEDEVKAFYDVCDGLYEEYFDTSENPDYDVDINLQLLQRAGFITPYITWGFTIQGKYPTKSADMESFTSLIMSYSMEDIESMYADYPIVVEKAKLLRSIVEQVGYIF